MSLRLEQLANPGAPRLVLVHGWGFSTEVWRPWVEALAPHYAISLLTLPGFAAADDERLHSLDTLADRLAAELSEPAIWVGWSLGGSVAATLAKRHPERVQALLTLACNPCFVARDGWPGMDPATFDAFFQGVQQDAAKTLGRFLLLQGQGDRQAKTLVRTLRPLLATDAAPAALLAGLERLAEDRRASFSGLAMPHRLLFGAADALLPAALAEQPLLAANARLLPDAGHALLLSAQEQALAELEQLRQQIGAEEGHHDR